MLPVVRGVPETARQIAPVHDPAGRDQPGVLRRRPRWARSTSSRRSCWGPIFLWRAFVLWRQATSPEGSLAQAIRLYKYSISYLTLLFAAVAIDSLLFGTLS